MVRGKIFDAISKEPLAGVSILDPTAQQGTSTDAQGAFSLNSDAKTLKISLLGYEGLDLEVPADGILNLGLNTAATGLETVVVTANRGQQKRSETPMAIDKISPELIRQTRAIALPELISKVPGVFMQRFTGEGHNMSIRQPMSTSAYFLYMEDGIPVRPMGLFNHNGLIESNIMALQSIEVVKGPASSIYGPEAVGGAINLITLKPTAVPTFSIGYQGDQYNYNRLQYNAGGMLGKKLGAFVGGFIGGQKNGWRERTDYTKNALNARLDYYLAPRTTLTGAFAYNDYDGQEGLSLDSTAYYSRTYEASNDFMYRRIKALRSRLTLNHRWNKNAESFVTAFHRFNDYQMSPNHTVRWTTRSTTATSEKNQSVFNSYGVIAQHRQNFNFLRSSVLVGGSYEYTPQQYNAFQIDLLADLRADGRSVKKYRFKGDRPDIKIADYEAQVHNLGLYTQLEISPIEKLRITAGLRYDDFGFDYENFLDKSQGTRNYQQISPKIGATYALHPNVGFYGNYSLGFAPPGVTQVFRRRPNVQAGQDHFYYNLKPAYFRNSEIGVWLALFKRKLNIDATIYRLEGRDELLQIRQPDNSTDFQSAGRTLHQGFEFGLTFAPNPEWMVRIGGATALHRFEDFQLSNRPTDALQKLDGKEMPNSPRLIANTEVIYQPKWAKSLRLSAEWQRLSPWFLNQINTVRFQDEGFLGFKGISVLNMRVGYTFKNVDLFINVLNATNELYVASASRGNNPTDRTNFSPAAPRSICWGLQYNFVGKQK
jgi:outer membrane receptor protein involved in Fe transport